MDAWERTATSQKRRAYAGMLREMLVALASDMDKRCKQQEFRWLYICCRK